MVIPYTEPACVWQQAVWGNVLMSQYLSWSGASQLCFWGHGYLLPCVLFFFFPPPRKNIEGALSLTVSLSFPSNHGKIERISMTVLF